MKSFAPEFGPNGSLRQPVGERTESGPHSRSILAEVQDDEVLDEVGRNAVCDAPIERLGSPLAPDRERRHLITLHDRSGGRPERLVETRPLDGFEVAARHEHE